MTDASAPPRITIVVPVRNEAGNVAPLLAEIEAAMAPLAPFEVIYVDDGSRDATADEIAGLRAARPWLRTIVHATSCGQSAAIRTGVLAARAGTIVSIDGDGQNDPAFIPELVARLDEAGPACGLVQGQRLRRKDPGFKRLQSRVANAVRARLLQDGTRDTGCGLKCFRRDVYLALPYFDALHRFMPALVRREGYGVAHVDVIDRPRLAGV
ncbi:MAG: glycosyltransferase, partial [Methylobacteriaceae bacterium]|nr:glycosyltransferase [Methylobacteriaceae bacterium]